MGSLAGEWSLESVSNPAGSQMRSTGGRECVSGNGSCFSCAFAEFFANDIHRTRGLNADANIVRTNAHHRNGDVISDENPFPRFP